jgi:DNA polymerase-3 subunit alpha
VRLIEDFSSANVDLANEFHGRESYTIDGKVFPTTALVEDDDGVRILIVPSTQRIRSHTWVRSAAQGAMAIASPIFVDDTTTWWTMVTAEAFLAFRREHHSSGMYLLDVDVPNVIVPTDPTYRSMVFVEEEQKKSSPGGLGGFVHLHAHSEFSALDGLSKIKEMVQQAVADEQPALSLDDHGTCAGHPELQRECEEAGIKPIFGVEAYFVPDRFFRPMKKPVIKGMTDQERDAALAQWDAEQKIAKSYNHLILWAQNDTGLQNIWAAVTESNREGFYGHPWMDWNTLERYSEGVMASTACLRGPIARAILDDDEERARVTLARLQHIFRDRMYVELHTNGMDEQIKLNKRLIVMANDFSLPTVAVVDSHYPCAEDARTHKVWMAVQTNKDVQDEEEMFAGDEEYHLMAEKEVRRALSYLGESAVDQAIQGTLDVANRCTATITKVAADPPFFSKAEEPVRADVQRLVDECFKAWEEKVGWKGSNQEYMDRFEREMKLLISKGFCGYFLIVADYVMWCKRNRILVGPGRGSGGGCLVAFLCGITEIDPVENGLLFERFMTEGRTELPDFDVDFPHSKIDDLMGYVYERWGIENVVRVGTHLRLKNRGVIRKLAKALGSDMDASPDNQSIHWPDIDAMSKLIDAAEQGTAGKGLPYDELMELYNEEFDPYVTKYPMLFEFAEKMVGRLASYGKHASGFVISTGEPLTGRFPLRRGEEDEEDGQLVAEYDMNVLAELGLVKFDLLALRTLDTIGAALDFIFERTGKWIDIYKWREEYKDQMVWDELAAGHTLGCFQIETSSMTRIVKRLKPQNLGDLADAITIVRPGPTRSGLTEKFFRRREGLEPVSVPDPRLEPVLSRTLGCILYQEDIMQTTMVLANYDGVQADKVRSILGKKKTELVKAEGEKFIPACVKYGMPEADAIVLWDQMAEFAKYSFNRAHAYGYAVVAYWCAWIKFNYPLEFLAALLSTVDKPRIPEFIGEARRMGFKVLPPDINVSGAGFMPIGDDTVRYGLDSVKGVGEAKLDAITIGQPYTSWEDFIERSKADSGVVRTLAHVGTFDSIFPNRRALEMSLEDKASGEADRCAFKDENVLGPGGLPCRFDWDSEPVEITKTGKEKKRKDPPKKCTKACRNYTKPEPRDVESVVPYTDAEIREAERELLGVYLSSTPFDRIPEDVREHLAGPEDIEQGISGEAFLVAAILSKVRGHIDKNGNKMAFLGFQFPTAEIDVTCFKDQYAKYDGVLQVNRLVLAKVRKREKGLNLELVQPLY